MFFDREPETQRLVELLQPTLQRGPGRFVAIVGPSGSGKSSLLHAGLLPRLARGSARWVLLSRLLPGQQPTHDLAGCLAQAFAAAGQPRPRDELAARLEQGPTALATLAAELAELSRDGAGRPNVLVVIDQAEELVTRSGADAQRALGLLGGALREDSPQWAVATVRSEFLSTDPERAGLAQVIDGPLVIEPLSRARLAEVIVQPAQRAGLDFEPGLVQRMVEDTAGGDALPLLAYTLRELAERAGPECLISAAGYEAVGGVVGSVQRRADLLADELRRRGYGTLVVPTLVKLATVHGEGEPTRRRVRRSTLTADEQVVVDAFVEARLVTSGHSTADPAGEAMVEVAHEALLRQWSPLREAIEGDRAGLRLRSELDRLASDWQQQGHDEAYLLRGGRLATVDQWDHEHIGVLGQLERQFVQASRVLAARELEAARLSNRRLRTLLAGLAVLLVAVLTATGVAWQQNRQAQVKTHLAQSRQLAARADDLVWEKPDMAILAGLHSLSLARDERPKPPPPAGLITGLAWVTHTSRRLTGHTGPVWGAAFSPDGRLLATTSGDSTVRLWEVPCGGAHGRPLTGHTAAVRDVAFSPDGRLLASASGDGTVRLWDVATGRGHGQPITAHSAGVWSVAYSNDGALLATTSPDGTARLWDAASGQPNGQPLTGHTAEVRGVAFSPDGQLLSTTGTDNMVRLWEVASGRPRGEPLTGHDDWVNDVAFSPDGRLLASASGDRTVRMWDVATGKPHGEPIRGPAPGPRSGWRIGVQSRRPPRPPCLTSRRAAASA